MDAVIRAAHPLAPIINAAFDGSLSYADLAAMLDPQPTPRTPPEVVVPQDELWTDLTSLYELGIEQAPDPETGRKLMLDLALLCLEQLGDEKSAEVHLDRILATDPCHSAALDRYVRLLIEDARFEEAIDLLERAAGAARDDARLELLIEVATISYLYVHDPDRAVAALKAAHDWDPTRIDVLARARVILIQEERWIDIKAVLDAETAHVLAWGGEADDAAMHALAEAYRLLGERVHATGFLHKLAEECFRRAGLLGDEEANEKYQLLLGLETKWASVADLCQREAFEVRDRRRAALLHLGAAALHLEYGLDFEEAEQGVDRSWLLDPGNRAALDLLERVYRERADLEQQGPRALLEKLIRLESSTKDRSVQVELRLRAARIVARDESVGDPLDWFQRVLELAPKNEEAIRRIDRFLADRRWYDERARRLEAELEGASGYRERWIRSRLGRLYAEKLGDYPRACVHLERVLAMGPGSFEAASVLRAVYRDLGDAEQHARVLEVLLDYCPDRKSRSELLLDGRPGARVRRFRKGGGRARTRRTLQVVDASCTPSLSGDNLAADGRKRRAEEERPLS